MHTKLYAYYYDKRVLLESIRLTFPYFRLFDMKSRFQKKGERLALVEERSSDRLAIDEFGQLGNFRQLHLTNRARINCAPFTLTLSSSRNVSLPHRPVIKFAPQSSFSDVTRSSFDGVRDLFSRRPSRRNCQASLFREACIKFSSCSIIIFDLKITLYFPWLLLLSNDKRLNLYLSS